MSDFWLSSRLPFITHVMWDISHSFHTSKRQWQCGKKHIDAILGTLLSLLYSNLLYLSTVWRLPTPFRDVQCLSFTKCITFLPWFRYVFASTNIYCKILFHYLRFVIFIRLKLRVRVLSFCGSICAMQKARKS